MLDLRHKKLTVWNESVQLIKLIYFITNNFPKNEQYGLVNQMRRAAISVASNLSEGTARKSKTERVRFYEIARASLVELDTQIEISIELGYIERVKSSELCEKLNYVFALLSRFITVQ